jgi:hypothetical protein
LNGNSRIAGEQIFEGMLPGPFSWFLKKGLDCESRGAVHDWYNIDNETSGCYHCQVERPGQLLAAH